MRDENFVRTRTVSKLLQYVGKILELGTGWVITGNRSVATEKPKTELVGFLLFGKGFPVIFGSVPMLKL